MKEVKRTPKMETREAGAIRAITLYALLWLALVAFLPLLPLAIPAYLIWTARAGR